MAALAILLVGLGIVLVLTYRPPLLPGWEAVGVSEPEPDPATGPGEQAVVREPLPSVPAVDEVSKVSLAARYRVAVVQGQRQRVVGLLPWLPGGAVDASGEAAGLEPARVLMDSIGLGLAELRQASSSLERLAAGLEASRRYDLSVVRDALERVRAELESQHRELSAAVDNLALALAAAAAGDEAGTEIKRGVATSYRLQSDARDRAVGRQAGALQSAVLRLSRGIAR